MEINIGDLISGLTYNNGFKNENGTMSYYVSSKPESDDSWSDEMTHFLKGWSRRHPLEMLNRKLALKTMKTVFDKTGRYIDFGCSSGYMIEDVRKEFPFAFIAGADYYSAGLEDLHNKYPDIPLFQFDITECPFKDNAFDGISCLNVLEHIKNDVAALNQIYRILKPDGRLFISVPLSPSLFDLVDEVHYHFRRYRLNELTEKVKAAGFRVLDYNCFGTLIYPIFYAVKLLNRFRYEKLPFSEKQKLVSKEFSSSRKIPLIDLLFSFENLLIRHIRFPIGIRGFIIATK